MFCTYSMLIAGKHTQQPRLDQLIQWLGAADSDGDGDIDMDDMDDRDSETDLYCPTFEGVVCFDECHKVTS